MARLNLFVTAAMAAFTVAIVVALLRMRRWKDYEPTGRDGNALVRLGSSLANSVTAWIVGFLLVTVGVGVAAVLFAGWEFVSVSRSLVQSAVFGGIGGLLALYLFLGTYYSVRDSGGPSARGAALGVIALGVLVLALIALKLLGMV